jgi:HtrA serine peptidase 2
MLFTATRARSTGRLVSTGCLVYAGARGGRRRLDRAPPVRPTAHPRASAAPSAASAAALLLAGASVACSSTAAFALAPISQDVAADGDSLPAVVADGKFGRSCVADAVAKVGPSVVNITRTQTFAAEASQSGDAPAHAVSLGSGFVYDRDGSSHLVLTNAHCVRDMPSACPGCPECNGGGPVHAPLSDVLTVTLADGQSCCGTIIAADTHSDVAIVSFDCDEALPVATLGNSETLRPGDFVVAVGSPQGLANSCSFGIVSNVSRGGTLGGGEGRHPGGLIQVDAAINSGSSGGPICDLDGIVRAMVVSKLGTYSNFDDPLLVEGVSFAIPISFARQVVAEMREFGKVRQPYVGVALVTLNPSVLQDLREDPDFAYLPAWLPDEGEEAKPRPAGLLVHSVDDDSPGCRAKLKRGDVILSAQGKPTRTAMDFVNRIAFHVDKDVVLEVRRASGLVETIRVRPSEQPN